MTPERMHELAAGFGVVRKQRDLVAGLSDADKREKAEAAFEFAQWDMSPTRRTIAPQKGEPDHE